MRKLQYLDNIRNLMTNFHMEKMKTFHFFSSITKYEVQSYTGYTPWQTKLNNGIINPTKYKVQSYTGDTLWQIKLRNDIMKLIK